MRIVLHGQQAFGQAVLEKLLERGEDVVAVCCAPTKEGKPEDVLASYAREKGLPVHQPESWKTPEALVLMDSFQADVCMMAYVLYLCQKLCLTRQHMAPSSITLRCVRCIVAHLQLIGRLLWGKTVPVCQSSGLMMVWMKGQLCLQKTCAIGPDETLGDVYFKKLFPMGVDAMLEGLDLVKSGVIIKHDQRLDEGTYEGWFGKKEAKLDWSAPVNTVYNRIRAANPAPGAWTMAQGQELKIYDSAQVDGVGTPGEVVSVSDEGVTVQSNGGRILIKRVRADEGKVPASEWANKAGITAGMTFGQ